MFHNLHNPSRSRVDANQLNTVGDVGKTRRPQHYLQLIRGWFGNILPQKTPI